MLTIIQPQKANNTKYSKTKPYWTGSGANNTRPGNKIGLFHNAPEPTRDSINGWVDNCGFTAF